MHSYAPTPTQGSMRTNQSPVTHSNMYYNNKLSILFKHSLPRVSQYTTLHSTSFSSLPTCTHTHIHAWHTHNNTHHMHTQISHTSLYSVFKGKRWVSRYTLFIQHLSHHFQHAHMQSRHTRNTHPYTYAHR